MSAIASETISGRTFARPATGAFMQWRAETVIFLTFWPLLMVAGRDRLFQDPGTFWHTVAGEQMLSSGELMRHDRFTFTFAGQPWIAHQWLGECLMAAVYRATGWDGLLICTSALLAALLAWLGSRLLRAGLSGFATAIVLGIVFLASAHHFHVRPHLASMVGMAILFGLLCDVEMGRRTIASLGWLIPLFGLWTNLHGGALGGLATVTIVLAGWVIFAALQLKSPLQSRGDFALLLAIWLSCLATVPLNPFGWRMLETWMAIMRLSLPGMIDEHGRANPLHVETWMLMVAAAGYLVMLTSTLPARFWTSVAGSLRAATATRSTWLVVLVWLVLACDRVRHVPLFVLTVAIALPDVLSASRRLSAWIDRGWYIAPDETCVCRHSWHGWKIPVVAVAVLLALSACGPGDRWAKLNASRWPVELVDDLRAIARNPGADHRIFNTLDFGGFITFHAPGLQTFIDDRCELFGDRFLLDYFEAETVRPQRLDSWYEEHHFQHALVRTGSPFDLYFNDRAGWRLVRRTTAGTLYRRNELAD